MGLKFFLLVHGLPDFSVDISSLGSGPGAVAMDLIVGMGLVLVILAVLLPFDLGGSERTWLQ